MKRYLLFCFENYYLLGGWNDFCGSYDSIQEAKDDADSAYAMKGNSERTPDYIQIVDSDTMESLFFYSFNPE